MAAFSVTLKNVTLKKVTASTGRIFATDNNIRTAGRDVGVCTALVCDWMSSCRKLNRQVKTLGEMSGSYAQIVAQSNAAYRGEEEEAMKSFNLTPPPKIPLAAPVVFANLAALISTQMGFVWVGFEGADGEGHTVGAYVPARPMQTMDAFEYLEPNDGLYRFTDCNAFIAHMSRDLTRRYDNAQLRLTDNGEMYLFHDVY